MTLAVDPPNVTGGGQPRRVTVDDIYSLISEIQQLRAAPPSHAHVPSRRRRQRPTNQPSGAQSAQATSASSNPNHGSHSPSNGYSQTNRENERNGVVASSTRSPPNSANPYPGSQFSAQSHERQTQSQAYSRNEPAAGGSRLRSSAQSSSNSNTNGRQHGRSDNQGAEHLNHRSSVTETNGDLPPPNPSTGKLTESLRGQRVMALRAAVARTIEVQQQGRAQDAARAGQSQLQSPPHPTPSSSSSPILATSYIRRQPERTTGIPTDPRASRTLPSSAPALPPRTINPSGLSWSYIDDSSGDDSEEDRWGISQEFLRPASGGATVRVSPAHQSHPRLEPQPRRNANAYCLICFDIPDKFPYFRPTSRCAHESSVCAPCLEQHISYAVQSQGSTTPTCPNPECRQVMEYEDVLRGARDNRTCLSRYEVLLRRRRLESEPNFVRCKSPTCDWSQIHHSGAAVPIVICESCGARSCFTHDVPWHTGLTCEQYTARRAVTRAAEDQASQAYISSFAKMCPNPRCGRRIEKTGGCDHMTCYPPGGCGHEFCWVCLADYDPILTEGDHRHNPTCTYYIRLVPTATPARTNYPQAYGGTGRDQPARPARDEANLRFRNLYNPPRPARPVTRSSSSYSSPGFEFFLWFVMLCVYMLFSYLSQT